MINNDNAKIDLVVKTYLSKCARRMQYINGKPNPEYYKLRMYILNNIHRFPLGACYDYAETLTEPKVMSFKEFVRMASAHRELRRSEFEKEKAKEILKDVVVPEQRRFTLEALMNL